MEKNFKAPEKPPYGILAVLIEIQRSILKASIGSNLEARNAG